MMLFFRQFVFDVEHHSTFLLVIFFVFFFFFFILAARAQRRPGQPYCLGFLIVHNDTPHSVGLL
jgi:hypothetical protein